MSIAMEALEMHEPSSDAERDTRIEARLCEIELSVARYGCFDLVEDDVAWLISTLRTELERRLARE